MTRVRAILFFLFVTAGVSAFYFQDANAQTAAQTASTTGSLESQINANTAEVAQLTQEIAQYQAELTQADSNKKTLQSAINALDLQRKTVQAQISSTQTQINTTQLQIEELGTSISGTEEKISMDQAGLAENLRSIDETDDEPLTIQLLSSDSLAQAWDDASAVIQVQNGIQGNIEALSEEKNDLASSQAASQQKKTTLTTQKQTLTSQNQTLVQTTQSKSQLLTETNSQEATYEKLLATAQAELTSFSTFAQNAGGSGLLTDQTQCDSWGCYYNQRDSQWGNDPLNGTQYPLKSDGCLITAMAMVMTHYGYADVTPVTINSNPNNFAAYYPAYLLYTINVDGVSATRKTAAIDATLATGNPVIVGLYAYGGTHYVVFVSGSKGNYIMRDPYVPNGDDVSFTKYYSMKDIFGVSKVVISS